MELSANKRKVLLIHPEAETLRLMEDQLRPGHECWSTHLAEEAVIICRENHFDLVYCYLNMSGMNGFEICHRIMSACPQTRVVLFAVSLKDREEMGITLWQPDDKKRLFEETCSIKDLAFYTKKILKKTHS